MYDALIVGAGAAGLQCALVLGSAVKAPYASGKRIGIIMHQKASHLQSALLNNVLGVPSNTSGKEILATGKAQLSTNYPHVEQIPTQKVLAVEGQAGDYTITTNKGTYRSKVVVIALGYTNVFAIKGLMDFVEPHALSPADKNRIQLKNLQHKIKEGLYVAGTLAGWRSQFAIAAGSGAQVATDILTQWNNGKHTKVHDKITT
ncbi:FAD-dependent oxidoreductase [Galbibacter sp.]|uniref:FAD-dependent oxidoreductase n=1 Tax=Galbibacter sp. TaxID=2918471 RepID=UPI002C99A81C|nr:FAD-dependent oxidoreductase [Galbibacter sp.]HLV63947.1 FAD-dependent oxidoreductase [Galbibacter sp.]